MACGVRLFYFLRELFTAAFIDSNLGPRCGCGRSQLRTYLRESGWSEEPPGLAGPRTAQVGRGGATLRARMTPPTSPTPSSENKSGLESTIVAIISDSERERSCARPAPPGARRDGGDEGYRVLPRSSSEAKKRSNKENAAARLVEMTAATAKDLVDQMNTSREAAAHLLAAYTFIGYISKQPCARKASHVT